MGCFDKTCSITNTAISKGDSCVIIRFWKEFQDWFFKNNKSNNLVYKLFNYLLDHFYEIESLHNYDIKDSYREIKIKQFQDILRDYTCYFGTYNDYWFIEEDLTEIELNLETDLYIHTFALEQLFNKSIEQIKNDINTDKIFEPSFFLKDFIWLCLENRINLFWKNLLGEQHDGLTEMNKQLKLLKETEKFLKNKIKKYKDDGYEL